MSLLLIVVMLIGPGWTVEVEPQACPMCVTADPGRASLFGRAAQAGTIGVLAHNSLAGGQFYDLAQGDALILLLSDGTRREYAVTGVSIYHRSQGLLCQAGRCYSEDQVFEREYAGGLVLQTCVGSNDGFYFVHARPAQARRMSLTLFAGLD